MTHAFDAGFYRHYYRDPRTRVASRAEALKLGRFACAYVDYLGFPVRRVLDAGCGLGHLRAAVRERFPRARYVGLEASEYLCRRYGWQRGSVVDYAPERPFDLVFCHDVLQYLDDRSAARAIANLGRLCCGALYFSVLTAEDWRKLQESGRESFTQALGRAAFHVGASGILARSAAAVGVNGLVFPGNLGKGESLVVGEGEKLRRLVPKN